MRVRQSLRSCCDWRTSFLGTRAPEVHLGVQAEESALQITVADNGRGVLLDAVQGPGDDAASGADPTNGGRDVSRLGHGLANMRQRAGSLGGTFRLTSCAKGGTLVTVRVPLAELSEIATSNFHGTY